MCWSCLHKKGGTPAPAPAPAPMRRSPPGRACLAGLDLQRKRPHADLTPEAAPEAEAEVEPSPPPLSDAAGDIITLAMVERTPSFAHATRTHDNPHEKRKR